jgi:hypothetical protein
MRASLGLRGRLGTLFLLLATGAAVAQTHQTPSATGIALGFGYGGATSACDSCSGGPRVGGTIVTLRASHAVTRWIRVGATIDGWLHSHDGADEGMGNAMVTFSYSIHGLSDFFIPDGLYFVTGVGLSTYRSGIVRHPADTVPGLAGTGWGYSFGLGYDLRVSKQWSLAATANHLYGIVGDVHRTDTGAPYTTGWKQDYFAATIALTFQP